MYNYLSVATAAADLKHLDECDSCMATALTTGVISVIITGLLVASISVAIHAIVYQRVYKPRLTSIGCHKPKRGGEDCTDVADERVGRTLEMEENEAYSVNERVGTTLEMENEAYSVDERVGGLELKQNEAYGVAKSRGNNQQ